MSTLFGIKNCDTVKKARKWLEAQGQEYTFHDFREQGLDKATLAIWLEKVGKDTLINKRSTTWKQLSDQQKSEFDGETLNSAAQDLVIENPTLIKRPVMESQDTITVGFKADQYAQLFN